MNVLKTSELTEFTSPVLTSLEGVNEESVYAPGYIQPHGILLALQEPHLKILQISENVEQFWGISAESLVGKSLEKLFSRHQVKQIAELLLQDSLELYNPLELKARLKTSFPYSRKCDSAQRLKDTLGSKKRQKTTVTTFRGTLHRTTDALLLELEPHLSTEKTHSIQFYHRLQAAIFNLRSAAHLNDLAQTLAKQVKATTGFERVMIYRFEADEHGVVIAEEKETHLESYLGLHFPTIDIPISVRKLFLRNWVRQIPDVQHTPVRLISTSDSSTHQPLDLSDCVLRGVSPCHLKYLQNMEVGSSLTISLIDNQRLWGLIACHHGSPKQVDYETRKTCEFLGQFASIELVHQQERELDRYRIQVKTIQDKLQKAFIQEPNFIQQVLTCNATELLNLVHAEGVAIALDQQVSLMGQTPPLADIQGLLTWLPQLKQPEIYLTNCLARPYPPARTFKHIASGILAISIVLYQKSYHIIWFRPEQIQTVNWAGNPQEAITLDEMGKLHLCPRKSFHLWKEIVQEMSLPWQSAEIEAAMMIRTTLMLAVLEFSQAALEQAAERAAIANRAKSQFLAQMSHELRTPLNAILGFTQVMNRSLDTPAEFQEQLSIINRSGEHLLTLINDVLEISRIEANQSILTKQFFNLHRLLQSLHEMFALKAAQKGLFLSFEKEQSVPRYVCSDEVKLRQILINLISNAIKFTTQGGVTIRVWAETSDQKQDCTCYSDTLTTCHTLTLSFTVEDTGCGIHNHDWEGVFDAFMQTEQGRYAQGAGLGLSISRQFARLMGGDITVKSIVNQGTTFTCAIVLHQPESMHLVEPETARLVIGLEPGQPSYRILVAEDVLENRQLITALLEPIGFEVRVVEDGAQAIVQWQTWHPHLILMDIQMPTMDGYEATQQIRLQEAEAVDHSLSTTDTTLTNHNKPLTHSEEFIPHINLQKTIIVALTAYAFMDERKASLRAGCDDHIAKPFTETTLFDTIARHLGVRYTYADKTSLKSAIPKRQPLTKQDLFTMPDQWIVQVHEAALNLDDEKIWQLIAQIPRQQQALIEDLSFLVDNFQLDVIATLTRSWGGKTE